MSGALDTINSFDEATKVGLRLSRKAVIGSLPDLGATARSRAAHTPTVREGAHAVGTKRLLYDTPLRH